MSTLAIRGRKTLATLVSATVLAASLSLSGSASAKPIFPKPFPAFGFGAAAFAGGLALGAIASGAASAEGDCYLVRRVVVDEYGTEYVRRVRVCD